MGFNISSYLSRTAARFGDRPALYEDDTLIATYAQLEDCVTTLAAHFRDQLGLKPGDRLGLFSKNRARFIEVIMAGWRAGLVLVPINFRLHPKEAAYILSDSGARLCFTSAEEVEALRAACGHDGPAIADLMDEPGNWPKAAAIKANHETPGPDLAWLFYTSGTTGKPKGVMITHEMLRQLVLNYLAHVDQIAPDDCILHFTPLSHGSGCYVLPHVVCGAANVVPVRYGFDETGLRALLSRYKGITSFMAPTLVRKLLDIPGVEQLPLESFKTIVYGGGPMYLADIKEAVARMGGRFVQIYGQGEAPMTITWLSRQEIIDAHRTGNDAVLGSVGQAYSGVEVQVTDAAGQPLPPGEIGEIVVRGPVVMPGYWRNPKATADTIRDGWLFTGDMGAFDEHGYLTLKDRSKDMIVSGGMNIYPREIEEVLLQHEAVAEVSVVGKPDDKWGEVVVAFVVAAAGHTIDTAALDAYCLENLARFKRPKEYRVLDSLPKNNYGKVLKRELRDMLAAGN